MKTKTNAIKKQQIGYVIQLLNGQLTSSYFTAQAWIEATQQKSL